MRPVSRRIRLVLASALLAAAPGWRAAVSGAAPPPVPADAVEEARLLEEALNGLKGLVASFTQTLESPGLPRPQIEKGTLYLLRPGRMRWEYDLPRGKLAIADGRKSYVVLPEERQVLVAPLDVDGSRAAGVSILLQRVDLIGSFEISWGPAGEGGRRQLQLKPRAPRPEYESLLVALTPDHLVRALTIVDPLGSRVIYRFDRMRRVETLDDGLFHFEPPASGFEVQEIPSP